MTEPTTTSTSKPEESWDKKLADSVVSLAQGQAKEAAMMALKYVAGTFLEGNKAICSDPNARIIEKTMCLVMQSLAGGSSGPSNAELKQHLQQISSKLQEVDTKVTQIDANVKKALKELDLVHLELAQLAVGADAITAIRLIRGEYAQFQTAVANLQDNPKDVLAYYATVITVTKLQSQLDTIFGSLTEGVDNKESLLGNMIRQIEAKGAQQSLLNCYRMYEEYLNSIILDLRKGNVVVSTALLLFEILKQNNQLPSWLKSQLAPLFISAPSWQAHWTTQIDTLLDHFNRHLEQFAITRSATASATTGAAPAQGLNPFFFPEDARAMFRAADAYCASQQETYGLRGRIFSMGDQFKGRLSLKDLKDASVRIESGPTKTYTFTIGMALDYWSATHQSGVYDKVEFSNQWTVHRFHIPSVGTNDLDIVLPLLPYRPPAINVTQCNRQTLQASSSADAVAFGSFVEIARAGGGFALLSGGWNRGSEDKDTSNNPPKNWVEKVKELRELRDFTIRAPGRPPEHIKRPEVGLLKGGPFSYRGIGYETNIEGTFRTWLETAKTIEFPPTSANEHIRLVWSLEPAVQEFWDGATADELNRMLRASESIRLVNHKNDITDADVRAKRYIIGVNFDPTLKIANKGCRVSAGVRFYPDWDGQRADWIWHYPALQSSAVAGAIQMGVFRESENTNNSVVQSLGEPLSRNSRKLRFRFEAFYDLRLELSGINSTPFVAFTRAQLANAYVELRPGSGGTIIPPSDLTLEKMLTRPGARCFAFDYDQIGMLDHVVMYDAGYLMVYGNVGGAKLQQRPLTWGPDRDWELKTAADEVFAFDYKGVGRLDHLVIYRPGEGKISIFDRHLNLVFNSRTGLRQENLSRGYPPIHRVGLFDFDLKSPADRVFAFDFNSTGISDHLVLHRPSENVFFIVRKKDDGSFEAVPRLTGALTFVPIIPYNPQAFAFDYDGSGKLDHLVLYCPGYQRILICKKKPEQECSSLMDFGLVQVYLSGDGIGGYDLKSPADRAFAFDYDGSGKLDHLVFYRPGKGSCFILKKKDDGKFEALYRQSDPGNGIGGYDLKSPADRAFAFDYDGSGKLDHLVLYRPGSGNLVVLKKGPQGGMVRVNG
jgi:hypothetical protein